MEDKPKRYLMEGEEAPMIGGHNHGDPRVERMRLGLNKNDPEKKRYLIAR